MCKEFKKNKKIEVGAPHWTWFVEQLQKKIKKIKKTPKKIRELGKNSKPPLVCKLLLV